MNGESLESALARMEAALARIEASAHRPRPTANAQDDALRQKVTDAIAQLDVLIAEHSA